MCPPGLPSFYLWDSALALARYQRTGDYFSICDFPGADDPSDNGVSAAHVVLHQVPQAVLKQYPFASRGVDAWSNPSSSGWHFRIRESTPMASAIATAVSKTAPLDASDVPLAMFAGLVREQTTADVDTTANALNQAEQLIQDEISAVSGNEQAAASFAVEGAKILGSSYAERDQGYYEVTITSRVFLPVTTGPGWSFALNAVKTAYQNGTSIAAALRSIAANGVRPDLFNMLADLHDENESRALDAANDPQFPSLGEDRLSFLAKAGAAAPALSYARFFTQRPAAARGALLAALSPSTPAVQPARSIRDLPASPPAPAAPAPSSGHLDPFVQLGIAIVAGGVVGGIVGAIYEHPSLGAGAGASVGGLGYLGVRKAFPEHFTTNEPLPPETKIVQ